MDELLSLIAQLHLSNVNLLALITDTSQDVVFYATVGEKSMQSNALAEGGILNPMILDEFYRKVAATIRLADSYKSGMMNIVKVFADNTVNFTYEAEKCRLYAIKKAWKESLGL